MDQAQNVKIYDLEGRTFSFAQNVRMYLKQIQKTIISLEDVKQLTRSSGSIGANYIEANEALSKKDFYMRIKICRKETKESIYWLKLLTSNNKDTEGMRINLINEATQLMKIFGSIITKSKI
ncbi:MAG: four helix bundle protein [Candidatus Levybacteria bacterium]|nr:four helix bundle protein [Candidatus Levybacteria bacterium]